MNFLDDMYIDKVNINPWDFSDSLHMWNWYKNIMRLDIKTPKNLIFIQSMNAFLFIRFKNTITERS